MLVGLLRKTGEEHDFIVGAQATLAGLLAQSPDVVPIPVICQVTVDALL